MGVLNVTPDSFSDGGRFVDASAALAQARLLVEEGADILDIGGESTRPGSAPVSLDTELGRILPVVEAVVSELPVVISVDTRKAEVARQALHAGAHLVNDISALEFDPQMAGVVRDFGAGLVLMHMQGSPESMQQDPYYEDVVTEVLEALRTSVQNARKAGIPRECLAVDPGIGFGKTVEQNLQLLAGLPFFQEVNVPVLVGTSRKSFIGKILNREVEDRLPGTLASVTLAVAYGAHIVRVHDVAACGDAARLAEALINTWV